MESSLTISNIYSVFEGAFHPGTIPRKSTGRITDAFVYFISGTASYIFDTHSFTARANTLFYLSKNSIYDIHISEPVSFICIDFDFCEEQEPQKSTLFSDVPLVMKNDFLKLFYLWNERNIWKRAEEFSILYSIYSQALKSLYKDYYKSNHLFSNIVAFISEHYSDFNLTIKTIASFADISETQLRRIFKTQINTTPIQYVTFIRLEYAKQMLLNSNYSIEEISRSVGITDSYYFSRLFKKEMGISPSAYRKLGTSAFS